MGAIGTDPGLVKSYYQQVADNLYDPTYIKKIPVAETASEPYLWVAMLFLVDCSRFGEFLSGLQNNYVKGLKKIPQQHEKSIQHAEPICHRH